MERRCEMIETRKVYYNFGYKEEYIPCIKLTGKWLEKLGFKIGDKINLIKDNDIIILMKADKQIIETKEILKK